MRHKNGRLTAILITTLFTLTLIWFIGSFAYGMIKSSLTNTEAIKFGKLRDTVSIKGYLIRSETVIKAPQSGELKKLADEGERVRLKVTVAKILTPSLETASGQATSIVKATSTGLVSYRLDGLEELFTLSSWEKLNPLEVIKATTSKSTKEPAVEKGKPLLKIVDNLKPVYLFLQVEDKDLKSTLLAEGENVELLLNEGSTEQQIELIATVKSSKKNGRYWQVIVEGKDLKKFLLKDREIDLELVKDSYQGYIVPQDCLVQKDGQKGVYIVYKKAVHWVEVKVVGVVGDSVSIDNVENSQWLNENTLLVTNPNGVTEGQNLR